MRKAYFNQGGKAYIPVDGISVTTEDIDGSDATVEIAYDVANTGNRHGKGNLPYGCKGLQSSLQAL